MAMLEVVAGHRACPRRCRSRASASPRDRVSTSGIGWPWSLPCTSPRRHWRSCSPPSLPVLLLTPALAAAAVAGAAAHHAAAVAARRLERGRVGRAASRATRPGSASRAWLATRARVPLPPQLASSAQPCDRTQAMRFDFDASRRTRDVGRVRHAPVSRRSRSAMPAAFRWPGRSRSQRAPDGSREVRNAGPMAWPPGCAAGRRPRP